MRMRAILYFLLMGLFFVFGLPSLVWAQIDKFVFVTDPQTVKINTISDKITIQSQDAQGNSYNITQTACVQLKTTSASGEFSSSNTSWNPVNILTMSKNTANRSFYYKDLTPGNYLLRVNIALRPETETRTCSSWPIEEWNIQWSAEQNINIISDSLKDLSNTNSGTDTNITALNNQNSSGSISSQNNLPTSSWPEEPQIYAKAGGDKTVISGADAKFFGQALGIKKEPLDNARYLWTFGDGAFKEGQNITHVYGYPGNYVVVLNVSSGKYSATDSFIIKVIPNSLKIAEANENFIKIQNDSNVSLDISGWGLKKDNYIFNFPPSTFIMANSSINIPSSVSGISIKNGERVELVYPNGSVVIQPQQSQKEVAKNNEQLVLSSTGSSIKSSDDKNLGKDLENKENKEEPAVVLDSSSNATGLKEDSLALVKNPIDFLDSKKWLALTIILSLMAGFFVFKIKKPDVVKGDKTSDDSDQFEIIEEK